MKWLARDESLIAKQAIGQSSYLTKYWKGHDPMRSVSMPPFLNGLRTAERDRPMSVFKRGSKWCYDFWVNSKRYRGAIPEARVKAQAERAEHAIRDQVYDGTYGKPKTPAPLLRDFITDTFLPWSKVNKRTWVHDEFRSR